MWKKIIIGLAVLLVAALLGLPLAVGFGAESAYRRLVDGVNQRGENLAVTGHFERGWLASRAETRIGVRESAGLVEQELVLRHDLSHGPLLLADLLANGGRDGLLALARVGTRYEPDADRFPQLALALEGRALARLDLYVGITGSARLLLDSPRFAYPDGRLVSGGVEGVIDFDAARARSSGRFTVGPVSLTEPGGKLESEGLKLRFEGQGLALVGAEGSGGQWRVAIDLGEVVMEGPGGVMRLEKSRIEYRGLPVRGGGGQGEIRAALGDVQMSAPAGGGRESETAVLRGAIVAQKGTRSAETGFYDYDSSFTFTTLDLPSARYGPGRFEGALHNLDVEAIGKLREALAEAGSTAANEEELAMARMMLLSERLPAVLASSPDIEVKALELTGVDGTLDGNARLAIDGSDPEALANPFFALMKIAASARLNVPALMMNGLLDGYFERSGRSTDAADAAPVAPQDARRALLAKLLASGVLVLDEGVYRLDARLEQGTPYLHDQPQDPTILIGLLPGM